MNRSIDTWNAVRRLRHLLRNGLLSALVIAGMLSGSARADALDGLGGEARLSAEIAAQGYCGRRVGNFATNDRAFAVRNQLLQQGHHAWVEVEGSLYGGTRSYAVYVAAPC